MIKDSITTMKEQQWKREELVSKVRMNRSFLPNRVICCRLSEEATKQVLAIQTSLAELMPGIKGKVEKNKLHMTLLAFNIDMDFEIKIKDMLRETMKLCSRMYAFGCTEDM